MGRGRVGVGREGAGVADEEGGRILGVGVGIRGEGACARSRKFLARAQLHATC